MPLRFFSANKGVSSSTEESRQTEPLIYAQPSCGLSEQDSTISTSPSIRPVTHKAISSDIFADVTYWKEQQAKALAAAGGNASAENDGQGEELEASFDRPATPPQGSRIIPWESYSNLPADHPVFLYPAEVREKMYKKGVDPVVKAMADRAMLGKRYGDKRKPVRDFARRGQRMVNAFGTMSIGAMS